MGALAGASLLFIFFANRKKSSPPQIVKAGTIQGVEQGGLESLPGPTQGSKFEYGWVNGNDRKGQYYIELGITTPANGTIARTTDLIFEPGRRYVFYVTGAVVRTADYRAPPPGMLVKLSVFDAKHTVFLEKTVQVNNSGYFRENVEFTPSTAGVYRVRASAGDSANEEPIVFNLLASSATIQKTLGN